MDLKHTSTQAGRRSRGQILGLDGYLAMSVIAVFIVSLIGWCFGPYILQVPHNIKLAAATTIGGPLCLYVYLKVFISGKLPGNQRDMVYSMLMNGIFLDHVATPKKSRKDSVFLGKK